MFLRTRGGRLMREAANPVEIVLAAAFSWSDQR